MSKLAHAIAATTISILAFTSPYYAQAEGLVRRPDLPDFTAHLPPIDEVPWLKSKSNVSKPQRRDVPEAGSLSALLFMPTPTPTWPRQFTQATEAVSTPVGM